MSRRGGPGLRAIVLASIGLAAGCTGSPPTPGPSSAREPGKNEWYAPLFHLVHENARAVRAVAYINVEWNAQEMWGGEPTACWGDSRIQVNALVRDRWLGEITGASWLHDGPGLFHVLGRE